MKSLTRAMLILALSAGYAALPACNDDDGLADSTQGGGLETNGAQQTASGAASAAGVKSPDVCEGYGGLTALLAEATVRCTQTIGPQSFFVDAHGLLQNSFSSCSVGSDDVRKSNLESVKQLIRLQNHRSALPGFQRCLTDRYVRWSELFKRTNLKSCPSWKQTAVFGEASKVSSKQLGKMQPKLPYVPASGGSVHAGSAGQVAPLAAQRPPPGLEGSSR